MEGLLSTGPTPSSFSIQQSAKVQCTTVQITRVLYSTVNYINHLASTREGIQCHPPPGCGGKLNIF